MTGKKAKPIIGNNRASPHWEDNDIVLAGWRLGDESTIYISDASTLPTVDTTTLVIGHNVKFDLLYLLIRSAKWRDAWNNNKIYMWDTQQAEYILSGQTQLFPSLDYCAAKYGLPVKDNRIKEDFWDMSIDTEDIPLELLTPYLKHDVDNAYHIMMKQREAMTPTQLRHAEAQMESLIATTEAELNGVAFDRNQALRIAAEMTEEMDALKIELDEYMTDTTLVKSKEWNSLSNKDVGIFLFGGKLKVVVDECILDEDGSLTYYKSGLKKGLVKTRKGTVEMEVGGICTPDPSWANATGWRVDDEVLNSISIPFATTLLRLRKLKKDIGTYYLGYSSVCWPDGMLHGNFQHAATVTGRLSSSNPNLQNITK